MYHVCPKIFGGPFLRLGISRERLSIPTGSGWGGKNTGWLATWDCPLRTDSASWKSLESFIQLISFCNSCILPVSSRTVSRSSTNFLLAIVSNLEIASSLPSHWDFSHELHKVLDFVPIIVHEEVVDLVEVVRLLDEHDKFLLFETRSFYSTFEHFFCHSRPGTRVFEALLDSQRESALFVVPEESWFAHFLRCGTDFLWRLEFVSQTVSQRVSPFYDRQTTTDWTTNLRHESDKLVYGSLHLLAPGWTVVKRALCRWWRHRTRGHSGTHSRLRIPGCTVQ